MKRLIAFRPDVGPEAGLGHLRRCLSLAAALRKQGLDSIFEVSGDRGITAAAGFEIGIAGEACAYVVDSYHATNGDLIRLGASGAKVIVVDDLADRELTADLVINTSIDAETLTYPGAKTTCLGIQYALLRSEFADEPNRVFPAVGRRLLVTVGGTDPQGLTTRFISALADSFDQIDVIVGPFFQNLESLASATKQRPSIKLYENPPNVRDLMLGVDLALTGGGQTVCELAATATPAVAVEVAENQRRNLDGFARRGAVLRIGSAGDPEIVSKAEREVNALAADHARRVSLGTHGRRAVDGRGADRAATRIIEQIGISR